MTELEMWHAIYDAAVESGRDRDEAAYWADIRYWPQTVPCPYAEVRSLCSPFRDPGKQVRR